VARNIYDRILGFSFNDPANPIPLDQLEDANPGQFGRKLPVDILASWVSEVQGGNKTQATMNGYFSLDAGEQSQMSELMGKVGTGQGRIQPLEFRSICQIAEYPVNPADLAHPLGIANPYGTRATLKARLGVTI
jgi:hypothetical protein